MVSFDRLFHSSVLALSFVAVGTRVALTEQRQPSALIQIASDGDGNESPAPAPSAPTPTSPPEAPAPTPPPEAPTPTPPAEAPAPTPDTPTPAPSDGSQAPGGNMNTSPGAPQAPSPDGGSLPGQHLEQDPNNPSHYGSVPNGSHYENDNGRTVVVPDGPQSNPPGNPDLPIPIGPNGPLPPPTSPLPPPGGSQTPPTAPANPGGSVEAPVPAPGSGQPSVPLPLPSTPQRGSPAPARPTVPPTTAPPASPGSPTSPGNAAPYSGPRSTTITSREAAEKFVRDSRGQSCGGDGQCASLVKALVADVPRHTSLWQRGTQVLGNKNLPIGTPIATFNSYGEPGTNGYGPPGSLGGKSGESHTGLYLGQNADGIIILHQWEHSGGPRIDTIPWGEWNGSSKESGDKYYTIK
jgi:hypothetical protein